VLTESLVPLGEARMIWRAQASSPEAIRGHADAARLPCGLIRQRHLGDVSILNQVKIGNDISVVIPDEAGTRAFGYLIKIESEQIALDRDRCNMQNRRRSLAK